MSKTKNNGYYILNTPKTRNFNRLIQLDDIIIQILDHLFLVDLLIGQSPKKADTIYGIFPPFFYIRLHLFFCFLSDFLTKKL